MIGVVPPLRALKSEDDLQREADFARDKPVQDMLDALGLHYPGGYSSRLPEPYHSVVQILKGKNAGEPSLSGNLDGLKLADTTVNIFKGGVGHAGLTVGNDPSKGFYPVQSDIRAGLQFVPGEMRSDDINRPHDSITFPTTPAQEAAIRRSMETHSKDDYNVLFNNCVEWVRDRLKDGGVHTTPPLIPMPDGFIESQRPRIK